MRLEIVPPANLEGLHQLCQSLETAGRELSLEGELLNSVVAAGAQAFGALLLAGGRDISMALERGPSQASLSLTAQGLAGEEQDTPPGLVAALFSPPALRVNFANLDGQAIWSAVWEL